MLISASGVDQDMFLLSKKLLYNTSTGAPGNSTGNFEP